MTVSSSTMTPDKGTCRWDAARKFNEHYKLQGRDLTLRLAENDFEVKAAQALRYRVFYEEMDAKPSLEALAERLDRDDLDEHCQHLIVLDKQQQIVGTYRLITREAAHEHGGFYTATEYNISLLEAYNGKIMELGRSCVAADYRTGTTMQLLWQGIANYVYSHKIEILFGCASLPGTDIELLKPQLSYLYHYHIAPENLRAKALENQYVRMDYIEKDLVDEKAVLSSLPPLVKGYLRVGGKIGDGAVVDTQFNTTDICLILNTEKLTSRYRKHFEASRENVSA